MTDTDYPHPDDDEEPDPDAEPPDWPTDDEPDDPDDIKDAEEFYGDEEYTPSNIIDPSDRPTRGPDPYH